MKTNVTRLRRGQPLAPHPGYEECDDGQPFAASYFGLLPRKSAEERVARAICKSTGDNPDRMIRSPAWVVIRNLGIAGRTGAAVIRFTEYPAWHRHRVAARAAIAVLKP